MYFYFGICCNNNDGIFISKFNPNIINIVLEVKHVIGMENLIEKCRNRLGLEHVRLMVITLFF